VKELERRIEERDFEIARLKGEADVKEFGSENEVVKRLLNVLLKAEVVVDAMER